MNINIYNYIKKLFSYRKLALRYHPKLSKLDSNTTYHYFCNISEAYEVKKIFFLIVNK